MSDNKELEAIALFEQVRWKGEPKCPYCGSKEVARPSTSHTWVCGGCKKTFTVKTKTVLEKCRIPLSKVLLLRLNPNWRPIDASRKLGISRQAAASLKKRLKHLK